MIAFKHIYRNIFEPLLQFISPNICLVCSDRIESHNFKLNCLCNQCYNNIPLHAQGSQLTTRLIGTIPKDDLAIDMAIGMINLKDNSKYMNLIYNLKYYNYRNVGYELGKELASYMEICKLSDFQTVIPVPIHSAKKRERGYNQSDLIAKAIAEHFNVDYSTTVASRRVYTDSQTTMNRESRSLNVRNVFNVKPAHPMLVGKRVLITDDVFTTGSTMNSLALELLEKGARSVIAATLAVA